MTDDRYNLIDHTQNRLSVDAWCSVLYTFYLSDAELDLTFWDRDAIITEAKCIWC